MLEIIREYGRERLEQSCELETARQGSRRLFRDFGGRRGDPHVAVRALVMAEPL